MAIEIDPSKVEDWQRGPLVRIKDDGSIEYVVNPYRIEALRAASRVVIADGKQAPRYPVEQVLSLAEQFARWLETGER